MPRGADAVVPVEHTDLVDGVVVVRRAQVPGGFAMAQALAQQNNTIIEDFGVSVTGIVIGIIV